jgi:hypothetical protein
VGDHGLFDWSLWSFALGAFLVGVLALVAAVIALRRARSVVNFGQAEIVHVGPDQRSLRLQMVVSPGSSSWHLKQAKLGDIVIDRRRPSLSSEIVAIIVNKVQVSRSSPETSPTWFLL